MKQKPIFKIGDKVKILQGSTNMIGKTAFITKIKPNDKDFLIENGKEYLYFIDNENRFYSYAHFFELDKQWDRENKLEKILENGLSQK